MVMNTQKYSLSITVLIPNYFKDTTFEVELTRDKNSKWCILIGDIYYMSGKSMKNTQIHDRINHCNTINENKYIDDSF